MQELIYIIIVLVSVVLHEVAHGYAAESQGDPTARLAGRLTLNPVPHFDLLGSIIIPLLTVISGVGFIGWARPVPYTPANLRNLKKGTIIVASAGIFANLLLAVIFSILIRVVVLPDSALVVFSAIVLVNLFLALFNLIPIPPLDGSKILFAILPQRYFKYVEMLERYAILLIILFIVFGWGYVAPLVYKAFVLLTGILP
jgi:Zn-dependent protease